MWPNPNFSTTSRTAAEFHLDTYFSNHPLSARSNCNFADMFEGLKVVELASVLAGPAVGMFFAELGATVIKIENKRSGGDVTRGWKVASEDKEAPASAYFSSVNWGKQHLFLDLKDPSDRAECLKLIADADVLLVNFREDSASKLGMSYEQLKASNPRLIYTWLTGFESEPFRVAYDVVIQAECGYMSMNGEAGAPPLKMPLAFMDLLAAHQLKEGVLCALLQRERSGKGSLVKVSLEKSALASLANQATNWLMAGHEPQRMGSLHPNIAPYGEVFPTKDEKLLVLAIGSDKQFGAFAEILNHSEWSSDQKFATNPARIRHRKELQQVLAATIAQEDRDELLAKLTHANVPAAAVKSVSEALAGPTAQQMILEEEVDGFASQRMKSVAFTISE